MALTQQCARFRIVAVAAASLPSLVPDATAAVLEAGGPQRAKLMSSIHRPDDPSTMPFSRDVCA